VTYYGDGRYLQNVVGFAVSLQSAVSDPVYPMFANNAGVTTAGVSTTQLVFIPSSGNLGLGSTQPGSKLTVQGDVKVSGVVTATTFYGSAAGLTGIPATRGIIDLNDISVGTLYYPTFVSNTAANSVSAGIGTTTGLNLTSSKLSFNPSNGLLTASGGFVGAALTISDSAKIGTGITMYGSTGIISATKYYGDGSSLTGSIPNSITNIDTNATYYPLLSQSTSGTISSVTVSSTSIVFNPGPNYLGIGSTAPTTNLDILGNARVSGVVTATTFSGSVSGLTDMYARMLVTSYGMLMP